MALNYNTLSAIPRLRSYEDAARREADTKPIRGDEEGRKPLGRRNQKWRHIKKMPDNSIAIYNGGYIVNLPLIRFMPNGDIQVYTSPYSNRATENEVTAEVTGMHVYTELGKAWIRYDGGTAPLREPHRPRWVSGQWVTPDAPEPEPSIFRKNERGNWVYINPPGLITHVVNRKGAKQVRERYAMPLTYIEALAKLRRDNWPQWDEIATAFADRLTEDQRLHYWSARTKLPAVNMFNLSHAGYFIALLNSEEAGDHYKAFLWLSRSGNNVRSYADRVLMLWHSDEWFNEREVPLGTKAHDLYAWVFNKGGAEA